VRAGPATLMVAQESRSSVFCGQWPSKILHYIYTFIFRIHLCLCTYKTYFFVIGILVDCVLSDWSAFGDCSATCGGGTKERTRSNTTQAANGGAACSELSESRSCNTDGCPGK